MSDIRNLLLPPRETGFGSLPADNKRHAVRVEIDSIFANVLHETKTLLCLAIASAIFQFPLIVKPFSFAVSMTASDLEITTKDVSYKAKFS